MPTPFVGECQASVFANKTFLGESIEELIAAGCELEVEFVPHVCSSLFVVRTYMKGGNTVKLELLSFLTCFF